jgi:hypothetical protein
MVLINKRPDLLNTGLLVLLPHALPKGCRGRDGMVVGFTTIYAIPLR